MPGRSWNEPDILELARLTVMVLSGADEQPLKFNKLHDWIGENRAATRLALLRAEREGWIAQNGQGIRLLQAGRSILNGRQRT
jgi:hypothetical protein